ncbi:tetraacyldisaccharide 4'-kinase [Helicobacter winghamensis]|uniref:Tetraacyldisaccharide 4'-kinase n=1 Tax=Helicobacter winghamensis TaxID=157268 RepID=A0A2N3PHD3_9HELI|nr:tetraacyldisaccharide 4'-kinase [Helicobacter winghamensis]EEO26515.1 tetraacyldisaccharide 4'-kinase [Helicobacter winghamensis ATCC BAA-430]PKT75436.1 tetraacyldisaccharide 4'-kinase [Helicobacter winghamensis]PKT75604.1 tetraacyldisaccharide 4'-kinase [Helicobacter winghamensis]PKT75812.1 tetraacyldisaccharide 4'-kinase [Helicobacter winghamensis]PKT79900.1 tetraacyldisaccharide 4'-kinase [Helicobacter winghamensis]
MRKIERYFYAPSGAQKLLAFVLLPFSFIYCVIATLKRKFARFKDFEIPIISVGNLVLGGSGKSPFIIEVAKDYADVCVVLRGYGRKAKGLKIVSLKGVIQESVENAGDEAIMLAKALPNASVIVSEKREIGIQKAKEIGAKIVFLDDGFRFNFKKLNILLQPKLEPYFSFCIPSGGYREHKSAYKQADIVAKEGVDYERKVELINGTPRMLLLTAIANPARLDEYLPNVVGKITLKDHSFFNKESILKTYEELGATSLLVTQKDAPKLEDFGVPLSLLQLRLKVNPIIIKHIKDYIARFKKF